MSCDLISVIIPVYNVAPYLDRCIRSVLEQTHRELEVVLIDDGSTDGSGEICDKFALRDPRIKVIHQQNRGVSATRNVGLDIATGEWIAFLDSDDWIEKETYEILLNLSLEYDADITSCKTRKIYYSGGEETANDTNEVRILNLDDIIKEIRAQQVVRFEVWDKLWRRELIGNMRFPEGQNAGEELHFDKLFFKANKMVVVDRSMYNYMVMRPGSAGTSYKSSRIKIFDEFSEWIKALTLMQKLELSDIVRCIAADMAISIYETAIITGQDKNTLKQLYKLFRSFYDESKNSLQRNKYAKFRVKLFKFSPKLFMWVRSIKK